MEINAALTEVTLSLSFNHHRICVICVPVSYFLFIGDMSFMLGFYNLFKTYLNDTENTRQYVADCM